MQFRSNKDAFVREARDKFFSNVESAALQYQEDLKQALDVPPGRTGKVYHNVKGKETHRAAAPSPGRYQIEVALTGGFAGRWEPPAPLSYELINSISHQGQRVGKNTWRSYVYSNVDYVEALEMGSDTMAPRPIWWYTLTNSWIKYSTLSLDGFRRG